MVKDANAPKRPSSAYMAWLNAGERARVMAANPGMKVGQVAKICGQNWKSVPDHVKAPLSAKYEQEMIVWKKKMAAYKNTDSYRDFQDLKKAKKAKGKGKKPKDKNAPKRNLSAYFLFLSEFRKENPNLGLTETSVKGGAKWKSLSESERAPFQNKSASDKVRYEREMETYKQSKEYASHQEAVRAWKRGSKAKKTRHTFQQVMADDESSTD